MGINKFRLVACACASVVYLLGSVPAVSAQSLVLDSLTVFTFSQPIELPGVVLPAGTYEFRFVDASSGRKVMRVTARDKTHKAYGLFITVTTQRPEASDDAELRLTEARPGQIAAAKTWWYPGESTGREFIYPREQARRIAAAAHTSVLTTAESAAGSDPQKPTLAYVTADDSTVAR